MSTSYPTPVTSGRTRVGWIGIGVMGSAMASRLLSADYTVTIYARTPSKADLLQSKGAILANSVAEVAGNSDVVFTMLGHPSDVREIVLQNMINHLNPNSVIVDHTSSHPILARRIYDSALDKHCHSIDAPVSGGDIGAKDGKLAILAGGNEDVVNWLIPLFDKMGKVTYVGGSGKGQHCKIANQITVGANLLGLSEGLVFAEKAGLDKLKFLEAVKGGAAGSMVMELFGERMINRDFKPGAFTEYMVKDLGMGMNVVGEDDDDDDDDEGEMVVVLPGAALSKQLFTGMVANGNGKIGIQGLITILEMMNGKNSHIL